MMSVADELTLVCTVVGTIAGVVATVVAIRQYGLSSRETGTRQPPREKTARPRSVAKARPQGITDPDGYTYKELYLAVRRWTVIGALSAFGTLSGAIIGFSLPPPVVRQHPVAYFIVLPLCIMGAPVYGAGYTCVRAIIYGYYTLAALSLIGVAVGFCNWGTTIALLSHLAGLHAEGT